MLSTFASAVKVFPARRRLASRLFCSAALCCGLVQAAPDTATAPEAAKASDFSAAERLLFMSNHLGALTLPVTLRYSFRKSGTLEEPFEDKVAVAVVARSDGLCCSASGEFLSGGRRLNMPDIDGAEGNPVVLYFLERDVREMQRLTKGAQNYFRKRIRMAIYGTASVQDLSLTYRGKQVKGKEIVISPFLDDPNRPRYEKLAGKEYRFMLSDEVPGGVFAIRSRISGETAAVAPLLVEELLIEGGQTPAPESPR
jgi:hypothetical protein